MSSGVEKAHWQNDDNVENVEEKYDKSHKAVNEKELQGTVSHAKSNTYLTVRSRSCLRRMMTRRDSMTPLACESHCGRINANDKPCPCHPEGSG